MRASLKVQLTSAALLYTEVSILGALSPPPTQTSGARKMFSEHQQQSCTVDIPQITEEVIYKQTR
jgi:hypothetical protein